MNFFFNYKLFYRILLFKYLCTSLKLVINFIHYLCKSLIIVLFFLQLVSMDGIQSGVPTLTTSTLTPTTLRSIEETFIQLTTDHSNPPCQAGFIPPPVTSIQNSTSPIFTGAIQTYNDVDTDDSQASWTNSQLNEENSMATTDTCKYMKVPLTFTFPK